MIEFKGIGVYKIGNNVNDRVYIGSTVNLQRRKSEHKNRLKRGVHSNPPLQDFHNKYGWDSLIFEVFDHCNENELLKCEQYYMDKHPNKFNEVTYTKDLKQIHSQETRYKIGKALTGKVQSKETTLKSAKARWKAINQFDLDGNFIATFKSQKSCGESLGINYCNISAVCIGIQKTTGGFKFEYK